MCHFAHKLWLFIHGHLFNSLCDKNKVMAKIVSAEALVLDYQAINAHRTESIPIVQSSFIKKFVLKIKQGKSEGFDSCYRPSNLTQIGLKELIFQPL